MSTNRIATTKREIRRLERNLKTLEMNRDDAMRRWPRLIAHMICESLGYFSPPVAANAILSYKHHQSFACEWYSHMCSCAGKGYFNEEELLKIGRRVILYAFKNRHNHHGYMRDFDRALSITQHVSNGGSGFELASWF